MPVIGAVVNIGIGAPASANIQIIPTDRSLEFLARTLVHLFYYDYSGDVMGQYDHTGEETEADFFRRYRLLFVGEVVAVQEARSGASRQVVLQCLDNSLYWDTAYQWMLSFGPNGSGIMGSPAAFVGANTNLFDDIINDPVSVVSGLIVTGKPRTPGLQDVKGLMGGLIRVLESMGGVWYTKDSTAKVRGINDFFTLSELRLKLLQQIGAEKGDDTAARLFSGKVFSQWLNNSLGGGGGLMSYRDILRTIFSYIYYNVVPCPCARYVPEDKETVPTTNFVPSSDRGDGREGVLFSNVYALWASLADLLYYRPEEVNDEVDEEALWLQAKASDLWLQAKASSARMAKQGSWTARRGARSLQEYYRLLEGARGKTALSDRVGVVGVGSKLEIYGAEAEALAASDETDAKRRAYYASAAGHLRAASGHIGLGGEAAQFTLVSNVTKVIEWLEKALDDMRGAKGSGSTSRGSKDIHLYPRLFTQIFRPDVWMVAPPRCNVLFPEQYNDFSFNRQYLREVTRLRLATSMEIIGPDPLLDYHYYAPQVDSVRGVNKSEFEGDVDAEKYMLMDHEIFSGIVPKFSHQSEAGFFANKAQKRLLDAEDKSYRLAFAHRAAHFEFFKNRFNSRALQVSGRFNPHLVCGFPAAVIRSGLSVPEGADVSDLLNAIAGGATTFDEEGSAIFGDIFTLPSQYVGMVSSLTHAVNQTGGHSNITMSSVRVHRTRFGDDDEFLRLERDRPATLYMTTHLNLDAVFAGRDSESLDWMVKCTPQSEGATPQVKVGTKPGPLGGTVTAVETSDLKVTLSASIIAGDADATTVGEAEAALRSTAYQSVSITESLQGEEFKDVKVDMPFEELVRPSWFAPVYANTHTAADGSKAGIGPELYQSLFGTGSVVDDQEITSIPAGSVIEVSNKAVILGNDESAVNSSTLSTDPSVGSQLVTKLKAAEVTISRQVSVAKAIDFLAAQYGQLRANGHDVEKFISNYTWRPVATMEDVLGSPGLEFSPAGEPLSTASQLASGTPTREGFHSRAFGPYEDGELLTEMNPASQYQRLNSKTAKAIDLSADPRKKRWERVISYVEELKQSRGLPG